jgi:hypothetical protein
MPYDHMHERQRSGAASGVTARPAANPSELADPLGPFKATKS